MPDNEPSSNRASLFSRKLWVLPLLVYLCLAVPCAFWLRDSIHPDAVSYLQLSRYLAEGNISASISGYWSPLLIWLIAPWQGLGLDGLYAGRLIMVGSGCLLIFTFHFFIGQMSGMTSKWKSGVLILVAIETSARTAVLITPDVLLSALLFLYLGFVGGKGFGSNSGVAFRAGIAGGLAYLAKSYALPFFVVHLSVFIAFRLWWQKGVVPGHRLVKSGMVSLSGFLLIAGPWIVILSNQYHRPTFSTVAGIAHAVVGPTRFPLVHPLHQLTPPGPGRLSAWETPEMLPYTYWSPVSNKAHFKHQLQIVRHNALEVLRGIHELDAVGLFPALFLVFGFSVLYGKNRDGIFVWVFMLLTCGIYCGGFLLVYFDSRYLLSFLWPLLLWFLWENLSFIQFQSGAKGRLPSRAAILSAWLFGAVPGFQLVQEVVRGGEFHGAQEPYREIARQIKKQPVTSLGTTPDLWYEGLYVSYHTQIPYHGIPSGAAPSDWVKQFERTGTEAVLIREGMESEKELKLFLDENKIHRLTAGYSLSCFK